MKIINNPERKLWSELCKRPEIESEFLESSVKNILSRVKKSGNEALRELTFQFKKIKLNDFRVSGKEIGEAIDTVPADLQKAIRLAAKNIEKFHSAQQRRITKIETMPGVTCWRKPVPIEKVGIYIPGGSAPLFSTVLMLGIPARLAGCPEVILCTPPDEEGKINPAILFTANYVGIKSIFKVGGAQAIAAMAFGTKSIPSVYKIFGPGNQFVTKAKQLVNLEGTAIDMPAGPSEVLVLADEKSDTTFVAADLLSQAEHGGDSQVMLVTSSETVVKNVVREIEMQVEKLPRKEIAKEALKKSRAIILEKDQVIDFVNTYAPEHLIINTKDCDQLMNKIINAGSIFLGPYSPESAGDYASGTNHTLPTNGFAKTYSGVSVDSFVKKITFQKLSEPGLKNISRAIIEMAEAEGLQAHAEAVKL